LAPSIQEKLSTRDGPAGIETLAKLADTFPPEKQEEALEKIRGFNQRVQVEIIKRSGGDLSKLEELSELALEGAFYMKLCRGLDECPYLVSLPSELVESIKNAIKNLEKEKSDEGGSLLQ